MAIGIKREKKEVPSFREKRKKVLEEQKKRNKPKVFGTKAGTLGVSSLSQVADKLGIKLKSLEESNPSIKDLNRIGKDQKINLPIRKKTFVERNILGKKTAPPSVTVKDKKETEGFRVGKTPLKDFTFKGDAKGRVYEGMTKKDMSKITLKKAMGGVMKNRGGTFKGTF